MQNISPLSRRVLAYILDNFFVLLLQLQISDLFPDIFKPALMIPGIFYFTVSTCSKWQATLGQRIFGIHVIRENGRKINFLFALDRYLSQLLFVITGVIFLEMLNIYPKAFAVFMLCLFVANSISIYWYCSAILDPKKRTLHDKIFNTLVVVRDCD